MPRITGVPKVSKVKVGTTVTDQTSRRIKALKSKVPDWIRTPGEAIDYCVGLVMDPSPRLAARLCWLLRKEAERSLSEEEPLCRPDSRFFYEEKVSDSECLRRLSAHFGLFADPEMLRALPNPMRRVDMASGAYVQFPEDWLVINPEEAPESEGAFAVEIDGGPYHPVPHLVYFGGRNVPERQDVIRAAEGVWPSIYKFDECAVDVFPISEGGPTAGLSAPFGASVHRGK